MSSCFSTASKQNSCTTSLWLGTNHDPPESPLCLGEWSASQLACKCTEFSGHFTKFTIFTLISIDFIFICPPLEVCFLCVILVFFGLFLGPCQIQRFVECRATMLPAVPRWHHTRQAALPCRFDFLFAVATVQ